MIARLAVLGLAVGIGVGGTALAGRLPVAPAPVSTAPATAPVRLAIPAATPALVCPGPETAATPDGATPLAAPGPYTVTAAAAGDGSRGTRLGRLGARTTLPLAGEAELRVLTRAGAPGGPLRLAPGATPTPSRGARAAALLAATQVTLARAGDLRGLTAATCGPAAGDAWLVGGATTPGRRARLLLTNPTPAPAVVDVLVAGPAGAVDVPSARGVVVGPGRVRAVQLDALAPGLGQLAVHVVARSGRVAAVLHDSWLRGVAPTGVDDVVPAAGPARSLVVPGVVVPVGGSARLRVAAATDADAVVRFRVIGPAGDITPQGAGVLTVPGGGVAEAPLRWLRPGAYTVTLSSDEPVVAGAVLAVAGPPLGALRTVSADLAWTAAVPALRGAVAAAVPRPVDAHGGVVTQAPSVARLVIGGADAAATVVVREADATGRLVRTLTLTVPAHRTVGATLTPATAAYVLELPAGRTVHAALVVTVPDRAGPLLTALPLRPAVVAAAVAPPAQADPALGSR